MNPKYILLATDGQPNCPMSSGDTAADDTPGAVMSVARRGRAPAIPTFVVGISRPPAGRGETTRST